MLKSPTPADRAFDAALRRWYRPPLAEPLALHWQALSGDARLSVYLRPTRRRVRWHLVYEWALIAVGDESDGDGQPEAYRASAASLGALLRRCDLEVGGKYEPTAAGSRAVPWWGFTPRFVAAEAKPALRRLLAARVAALTGPELAEHDRREAAAWRAALQGDTAFAR